MTKRASFTFAAVVLALGIASGSGAAESRQEVLAVKATLTALQEVPRPNVTVPRAYGHLKATLTKTRKGYRLNWRLTYGNLSGPAKSAYIHRGRPGKYGAAFFHLCSPCHSGAHGSAYASPFVEALMLDGKTYVNIRTAKNPAGEIRGQIANANSQ